VVVDDFDAVDVQNNGVAHDVFLKSV